MVAAVITNVLGFPFVFAFHGHAPLSERLLTLSEEPLEEPLESLWTARREEPLAPMSETSSCLRHSRLSL